MSERRMAESIAARLARVDDTDSVVCGNCGHRNDPVRRYCSRCATPLGAATAGQRGTTPIEPFENPPPHRVPAPPRAPEHDVGAGKVACPTCGTVSDDTLQFCPSCGTFLQWQTPDERPVIEKPATFDPSIMYATQARQDPPPTPTVRPGLRALLTTLIAYVPTTVLTLFLPVWSAVLLKESDGGALSQLVKLGVAIVIGVIAGASVWRLGYRLASQGANPRRPGAGPRPFHVLRVGGYEIAAASIAGFAWATAAPSSWAGFSNPWWPLVTVAATTVVIAVIARLVAPLEGDRSG